MVVLGLTGGIACGKSTAVTALLRLARERLGSDRAVVLADADQAARAVVAPGTEGLQAVAERFGADLLLQDGQLDRARLGTRVFADPEELAALNALLHPRIRHALAEHVAAARQAGAQLCIVDAALLFEMGLDVDCDAVVTVACDPAHQIARLQQRNGLDEAAARQRIAAQWTTAQRRARAAFTLDNRAGLADLAAAVSLFWDALLVRFPGLARRDLPGGAP